jgi:hypothetical protein
MTDQLPDDLNPEKVPCPCVYSNTEPDDLARRRNRRR